MASVLGGAARPSAAAAEPRLALTPGSFQAPCCPPPLSSPPQDGGISDWAGVAAVLCGQKDMATAVKELLAAKGVPESRVLTNF